MEVILKVVQNTVSFNDYLLFSFPIIVGESRQVSSNRAILSIIFTW